MNRAEFMKELAFLLQDIQDEEKEEVLQYYNDYFDEGGEAKEAQIVRELESPEKVAAIIKDGLRTDTEQGEFSERGYSDERFTRKNELQRRTYLEQSNHNHYEYREQNAQNDYAKYQDNNHTSAKQRSVGEKIVIIVLVILFIIPIVLPIGLAILGALFGLMAGVIGLLIGLLFAAAALVIAGIATMIAGLVELFTWPAAGLALCGAGLFLFGLGFLSSYGMILLMAKVVPSIVRGFVSVCRMPFRRGGRTA